MDLPLTKGLRISERAERGPCPPTREGRLMAKFWLHPCPTSWRPTCIDQGSRIACQKNPRPEGPQFPHSSKAVLSAAGNCQQKTTPQADTECCTWEPQSLRVAGWPCVSLGALSPATWPSTRAPSVTASFPWQKTAVTIYKTFVGNRGSEMDRWVVMPQINRCVPRQAPVHLEEALPLPALARKPSLQGGGTGSGEIERGSELQ